VPRFYFHLFNDEDILDREGAEFDALDGAVEAAQRMARGMAAESVILGRLVLHHRIEIADEAGETIKVVHYGDVVEVKE
jgi:hypothetical protein